MATLTFSSLLWIVPLLFMKNYEADEVLLDLQRNDNNEYSFADVPVTDEFYDETDASYYAYSIVDEMITVALSNKIVSKRVSEDFAFSIN